MEICDKLYPQPPPGGYRYVNTGVWVGRTWAAKRFLNYLIENTKNTASSNDQELAANIWWRSGGKTNFTVDHMSNIFQNFHPWRSCVPSKDVAFETGTGDFHNFKTGTKPVMLHFSGGGKDILLSNEHGIWYMQPDSAKPTASHPARLSYDEVTNHEYDVAPVPGIRDEPGKIKFKDTRCGPASKYTPEAKWKRQW